MSEWLDGDYRLDNDTKYLHYYHLPEDEDLIVTIKGVKKEELENKQKGTKEIKSVLYFEEEDVKPLALNKKVNPESISKALGTRKREEWRGHRIALYRGAESRSPDGYAVRIRDTAPKVEEAYCEDCKQRITKHGNYSVNKIVTMSEGKYGAKLCWDCCVKRKEAAND